MLSPGETFAQYWTYASNNLRYARTHMIQIWKKLHIVLWLFKEIDIIAKVFLVKVFLRLIRGIQGLKKIGRIDILA